MEVMVRVGIEVESKESREMESLMSEAMESEEEGDGKYCCGVFFGDHVINRVLSYVMWFLFHNLFILVSKNYIIFLTK